MAKSTDADGTSTTPKATPAKKGTATPVKKAAKTPAKSTGKKRKPASDDEKILEEDTNETPTKKAKTTKSDIKALEDEAADEVAE